MSAKAQLFSLPARLRERYRIIRMLVDFQKSKLYPILFALMCAISAANGMKIYIPLFWLMTVAVLFSIIFTDDTKVLLVPMFIGYYAVGCDVPLAYHLTQGETFAAFHPTGLANMLICGSIMVVALITRIILDGTLKKAFQEKAPSFLGMAILCLVIFLSGIFSKEWAPMNLFYGFLMSICLFLFYCILYHFFDNSNDLIPYACHTLVCGSCVILVQIITTAIRLYLSNQLFTLDDAGNIIGIERWRFIFSWGFVTIAAAVLVLGIPAALYLTKKSKFSFIYLAFAVAFLLGAAILSTRSALVAGCMVFVINAVTFCFAKKRAKKQKIYAIAIVSLIIVLFCIFLKLNHISLSSIIARMLKFLRFLDSNNNRIKIWKNAIDAFVSSPIFGVGFLPGNRANVDLYQKNIFALMYHNLPLQLLASTGIVGAVAFLFHFKDVVRLAVRRFSVDKFMLLLVPLMVLAMSLVDNFFFYLNFQIPYAIFLMLVERKERKQATPEITE